METMAKGPERESLKKSRKQKKLKLLKGFQSPFPNSGIMKPGARKKKSKRLKKIAGQYLGSLVQEIYERRATFVSRQEENSVKCGFLKGNVCEQTIDLCDSETSVDNSNSNVLTEPSHDGSHDVKKNSVVVIDLSKDLADQYEVIDLTDTMNTPKCDFNTKNNLETTVIDISEDDSKDQHIHKPENDEVFVTETFDKKFNFNKNYEVPSIVPLSNKRTNFNNLIPYSGRLKSKYFKKESVPDKVNYKHAKQFSKDILGSKTTLNKFEKVGENIYVHSPVKLPSAGLRPIIIDGSNVAFVHSKSNFSSKRLEICINYFKEKGHQVTAFVPQFRINNHKSDDPQLLRKLERQGDVVLTPSKKVDGINIVPYDDRFIVQTAVLKGGIIVTRDNYNDLLRENPAWAETIKYRTLAFTWVDDVLMFPKDPLGEYGPSLEEFLRFH